VNHSARSKRENELVADDEGDDLALRRLQRSSDADLSIGHDCKTTSPALDNLRLKYGDDALKQRVATRSCQSNDEQASMSAGRVLAQIGEVEVLRDEETLRRLRRAPDIRIRLASSAPCEPCRCRDRVRPELQRDAQADSRRV
jgi:hypothetical protein